MPFYGSASDGDMAARGARVRLNREMLARFRRGECGPLEVTADDLGNVSCPVLVLAGEDDPVSPVASTRRITSSARHLTSMSSPTSGAACSGRRRRRHSPCFVPPCRKAAAN